MKRRLVSATLLAVLTTIMSAPTTLAQVATAEPIALVMAAGVVSGLKASAPDPSDGATGVTNPLLKWRAGETAKWHDVYLGTNPTLGAAEHKGRQPQAWNMWFETGDWIPGQTYYWRIDEVEEDGSTIHTGDVWSFTAAGAVPGVKASDPDPPDGATGVTSPLLKWEPGETAKWHDVYLGTDPTLGAAEHKGRQPQAWNMWFETGDWIPGQTYYWRIDEVEEDGTTIHTGDVWSFTAAPHTAHNPDPPDGASNVPTDADLSWVPGATAITHDVYFGTDHTQVANGTGGTFKGNQPDTVYDPGTLQMGSTYYWRIDEVEADATTIHTGDVWSFTVVGAVPGVKASDPDPVDGATGVTSPLLAWTAGETAKWHDVYLGTSPALGPAEHKGRQPLAWTMWFEADGWIAGTTYYWRIDEVEEDGITIHTGDVWSFTAGGPHVAHNPNPPDGARNVPTYADLSWTPGFDAITHDVYFGAIAPEVAHGRGGTFKGNQHGTVYDPGTLQEGSTYYWRIDEIDAEATKYTGDVWSFTVVGAVPSVRASDPDPPDGATGVTSPLLRWTAGETAKWHDVYLGTNPTPGAAEYKGRQPQAWNMWFETAGWIAGETYYWRIDEIEEDGTTIHTGDVWSFKTFISPEGQIYHVDALTGDDNNDGLSPETAFTTIQMGIDSAEPTTTTILVYPGVYTEAINFKGKAITLASAQDAAILEAPGDYAVSFHSGEGPTSILKNFVIRNSHLGIFIVDSSPTISNVTVVDNEFGIAAYADSNPDISNAIFWNNADGDLSGCQATYSCIEQVSQGEGNISIDPLLADPANGDCHLLSRKGRYVPAHGLWSFDEVTSFCVDAGDPAVDPSNERMPNGGRINMGAYGGTAYASMSEWPIASDLNLDGVVDLADLSIVSRQWLMELPSDGVVPEHDPPVPDPAQWDPDGQPQEVYGGGDIFDYSVEMRAMEAADASGWVEYFFECTTDLRFSSGWQRSPEYRVPVGRRQSLWFRVKARDLYGNETAWSEELPAEGPT